MIWLLPIGPLIMMKVISELTRPYGIKTICKHESGYD